MVTLIVGPDIQSTAARLTARPYLHKHIHRV